MPNSTGHRFPSTWRTWLISPMSGIPAIVANIPEMFSFENFPGMVHCHGRPWLREEREVRKPRFTTSKLVGGWGKTPLKHMSSSIGMIRNSQYQWENAKKMATKPLTRKVWAVTMVAKPFRQHCENPTLIQAGAVNFLYTRQGLLSVVWLKILIT